MESESRRPGSEATANNGHDGKDHVSPNSSATQEHMRDAVKQFECIPVEMRNYRQWVCWRKVERQNKKPTKVPYKPDGTGKAHVNKPEHWATFDEAVAAFKAGGFDGIGFVFTDNDPFTGIDLDDVHGDAEALATQMRIDAAFNSYAERSPSGYGLHIIVKGKATRSKRRGKVEVYSSGRYFTMTGDVYRDAPIIDCQGLLDVLVAQLGGTALETLPQPSQGPSVGDAGACPDVKTVEHLRSALAYLDADPHGEWVDVGHALKTIGEAGRELWLEWSKGSAKFNPLEAEQTWASFKPDRTSYKAVFTKAQARGWTNPGFTPDFPLVDSSKITAELQALIKPKQRTQWTADELWDANFPPIEWIVPTLLAPGLTLLVGAPKLGKSWLALDLANSVAHGGFALNLHCPQGDVLYAALEDTPRRLNDRLQRICTTKPGASLCIWTEMPTLDHGGIEALRNWITSAPNPRLIVIDVLSLIRPAKGKGEDAYVYDCRTAKPLKALADEFGLAVVVVHHTRKAEADDVLERTSGTNGLTGTADTTLVLSRNTNGAVLAGRGRDVEELELALDFNRDTCRWESLGRPADVCRSDERAAILEAVAGASGPLSPQEIAFVTGQSSGNIRRLLGKMVMAGELRKEGRGKYAHPYTPGNNGNKVTNEGSLFS